MSVSIVLGFVIYSTIYFWLKFKHSCTPKSNNNIVENRQFELINHNNNYVWHYTSPFIVEP